VGVIQLHYGWTMMLLGMLATMASHGLGRMSFTLILPPMKAGLGLTYTQAGLLGTGNFVGYVFFSLVGGFLATRYGSRRVISLSLALMGTTMALTGLARSFPWAFVMRLLTGVGNGGAYVPAMALGSAWFTARYRGVATGIVAGGVGLGTMLGAVLVPLIIRVHDAAGWRFAWYYLGGLALAVSAIAYGFLKSSPEEAGMEPVGSGAGPDPGNGPGATTVNGFPYREKGLWHLGLVYLAYGFSYVIYMTFFAAYLNNEIGWPLGRVSTLWALVGGLSIISGGLWGRVSDYLGRRYGLALVYLALMIAYLAFAFSRTTSVLCFSAILYGLSFAGIPTIMAAASGDFVGPRLAPAGLGFVTVFFGIGQALGPAVAGSLADATRTFAWAFLLAAALSALGLAGSLLLRPPPSRS
jgi:MFS family permease